MGRFSLRGVLLFVAVYATYLSCLLAAWSWFGKRALLFPDAPIIVESLILLAICAAGMFAAQRAWRIDVDDDWRRGGVKLGLILLAVAIFALSWIWLLLLLWLYLGMRSAGVA